MGKPLLHDMRSQEVCKHIPSGSRLRYSRSLVKIQQIYDVCLSDENDTIVPSNNAVQLNLLTSEQ